MAAVTTTMQGTTWVFASVYLPSTNYGIDFFTETIDVLMDAISAMRRKAGPNHRFIAGGDFNAPLTSADRDDHCIGHMIWRPQEQPTQRSDALADMLRMLNLRALNSFDACMENPTPPLWTRKPRTRTQGPTQIDWVLIDPDDDLTYQYSIIDLFEEITKSDHRAIRIYIDEDSDQHPVPNPMSKGDSDDGSDAQDCAATGRPDSPSRPPLTPPPREPLTEGDKPQCQDLEMDTINGDHDDMHDVHNAHPQDRTPIATTTTPPLSHPITPPDSQYRRHDAPAQHLTPTTPRPFTPTRTPPTGTHDRSRRAAGP